MSFAQMTRFSSYTMQNEMVARVFHGPRIANFPTAVIDTAMLIP
jgi:hypothetical protein